MHSKGPKLKVDDARFLLTLFLETQQMLACHRRRLMSVVTNLVQGDQLIGERAAAGATAGAAQVAVRAGHGGDRLGERQRVVGQVIWSYGGGRRHQLVTTDGGRRRQRQHGGGRALDRRERRRGRLDGRRQHRLVGRHRVLLLLLLLLLLLMEMLLSHVLHQPLGGGHAGRRRLQTRLVGHVFQTLLVPIGGVFDRRVGAVGSAGGRRRRSAAVPGDRRSLVGTLGVLLHVLAEVGLLRVGLAAVLADVRLEMLGLLVLGDVLEQRRLVREALVARVALVRLVRLVAARVRLQVAQLREGLVAANVPALVRLVASVRADVLLQVRQLRELALADLAAVRFDAEVDARVLRQVGAVGERFGALRALVGLGLAHVQLRVQLQLGFGSEHLEQTNDLIRTMQFDKNVFGQDW
jgi:hypothetical protein